VRRDVLGLGLKRRCCFLLAVFLPAAWGSPPLASAAEPLAAARAAEQPLRIWYRSSEGCPDGAAFVGLLGRLGRAASLAGVGDRVDFVVTVAYAPGQSSGRLERQSNEGTVAIRDVSAQSCAEVADALALSLDLALEPGAAGPASAMGEPTSAASTEPLPATSPLWQTRLGVQGQFSTGLAGAVLPGAALFVDLLHTSPAWSARLSLWGARGEQDAAVDLQLGLLGSRLESCWTWSAGVIGLSPCLGVELGILVAEGDGEGGRSDTGLWSSAVAHLRTAWHVSPSLALEAQAGVVLPFVRYRFDALTGAEVKDSAAVGLQGAIGLSFLL
jgi:hypothetical protein